MVARRDEMMVDMLCLPPKRHPAPAADPCVTAMPIVCPRILQ